MVGSTVEIDTVARQQGEVRTEVSYRSRERRWDLAVRALNARLSSSNWALLPLSQTAGNRPWSEGSACSPSETKPGYQHPEGTKSCLL